MRRSIFARIAAWPSRGSSACSRRCGRAEAGAATTGRCDSCGLVLEEHPNVRVLAPASEGASIGVEATREALSVMGRRAWNKFKRNRNVLAVVNRELEAEVEAQRRSSSIVGKSPEMKRVLDSGHLRFHA